MMENNATTSPTAERPAIGSSLSTLTGPFDLTEVVRFDPMDGLCDLERHLARMKASAATFGFQFDRHAVRNELQAATFRLRDAKRVRLRLSPTGMMAIEIRPPSPVPSVAQCAVVCRPVPTDDIRLRHKTTDRGFYDAARAEGGTYEVVMIDDEGFVTEGSFTNIFIRRNDGTYATPPLSRGLLPGVLRQHLIEEDGAVEQDLSPQDLQGGFFIGNSARGLIPATLVAVQGKAGL